MGDFVESVLDGRRGQVVSAYDDIVNVRFGINKTKNNSLEVTQEMYPIITMNEWELRAENNSNRKTP